MKSHYGLVLRQLRQHRGLSIKQLAYEAGCHESVIIAAESNLRPIPGENIIAYSNALRENFETLVSLWLQQVAEKILPEGHPGLSFTSTTPMAQVNTSDDWDPAFQPYRT